jgi:hypothetical protein
MVYTTLQRVSSARVRGNELNFDVAVAMHETHVDLAMFVGVQSQPNAHRPGQRLLADPLDDAIDKRCWRRFSVGHGSRRSDTNCIRSSWDDERSPVTSLGS